jgi:hypothetical protein
MSHTPMCCFGQHLHILWNLDCLSPFKISTCLNLLFTNALALKAFFVWAGGFELLEKLADGILTLAFVIYIYIYI